MFECVGNSESEGPVAWCRNWSIKRKFLSKVLQTSLDWVLLLTFIFLLAD